jgi:GGDEF domain-containing protein
VERFALLLRSECRRYDVVARLEDYRFALLLPRVSAAGGLKAARRMSEIWRLTTLEVGGLDCYVPAFMAVECHQGASPAPSGSDLLKRAVTAVERSKQNPGQSCDGVVGPSPDPYAVSIWSDYLVNSPSRSES